MKTRRKLELRGIKFIPAEDFFSLTPTPTVVESEEFALDYYQCEWPIGPKMKAYYKSRPVMALYGFRLFRWEEDGDLWRESTASHKYAETLKLRIMEKVASLHNAELDTIFEIARKVGVNIDFKKGGEI